MKVQHPPTNLKRFPSWEKQALRKFELNGTRIYLVTEFNQSYGELITAFQIGEEPYRTPVRWKDMPEWFLECQPQNNLIGERPFEEGSITYEFLYKDNKTQTNPKRLISKSRTGSLELHLRLSEGRCLSFFTDRDFTPRRVLPASASAGA